MKKFISTFMIIASGTLFIPALPATAAASLDTATADTHRQFEFENFFAFNPEFIDYGGCPRGTFRVRKHTRTKKKLLNTALATGVGTALGAGIGGGRGALLGAGIGAGGYLTYRYVKDRRGRCVRVRA
jgi:hypothetical protein